MNALEKIRKVAETRGLDASSITEDALATCVPYLIDSALRPVDSVARYLDTVSPDWAGCVVAPRRVGHPGETVSGQPMTRGQAVVIPRYRVVAHVVADMESVSDTGPGRRTAGLATILEPLS